MDNPVDTKKFIHLLQSGSHQDSLLRGSREESLFNAVCVLGGTAAIASLLGSLYLLRRRVSSPMNRGFWSRNQRPTMNELFGPQLRASSVSSDFKWLHGITRYMTEKQSWWSRPDATTRFQWAREMNEFVAKHHNQCPGNVIARLPESEAPGQATRN